MKVTKVRAELKKIGTADVKMHLLLYLYVTTSVLLTCQLRISFELCHARLFPNLFCFILMSVYNKQMPQSF